MHKHHFLSLCLVFFLSAAPVRLWAGSGGVNGLLGELDTLLQKEQFLKSPDPALVKAINKILDRYRPVIHQELLLDSFADGDYTNNPTWEVLSGSFRIDGYGALFSSIAALDDSLQMQKGGVDLEREKEQKQMGQFLDLMQTLSNEGKVTPKKKANKQAIIHHHVATPNSFTLSLSFRAGQATGQGEIGLYIDNPETSGYRLLLSADPNVSQSVSLLRYDRGRPRILRGTGGLYLGDGLSHQIKWQRLENGQMHVWVDGVEMLRLRDSSHWNGFSGVVLVNNRGEFAFDNIVLQSMQ